MYCIFCEIVAQREPATVHYEDDDIIVITNHLRWDPVMLLALPRQHMTQEELWSNELFSRIIRVSLDLGTRLCPQGFRFVSNFGEDAMQSQEHGHLHVLGGTLLGRYLSTGFKPPFW